MLRVLKYDTLDNFIRFVRENARKCGKKDTDVEISLEFVKYGYVCGGGTPTLSD